MTRDDLPEDHDPVLAAVKVREPWWREPTHIRAFGFVLVGMALIVLAFVVFQVRNTSDKAVQIAEHAVSVQAQNSEILHRLDHEGAGVDELVQFIHDLEQQQAQAAPQNEQNIQDIFDILCSTNDPVRQAACVRLGHTPTGG